MRNEYNLLFTLLLFFSLLLNFKENLVSHEYNGESLDFVIEHVTFNIKKDNKYWQSVYFCIFHRSA